MGGASHSVAGLRPSLHNGCMANTSLTPIYDLLCEQFDPTSFPIVKPVTPPLTKRERQRFNKRVVEWQDAAIAAALAPTVA